MIEQKIYLQGVSHFIVNQPTDLALRQQLKALGVDARRLSRFTQLCLLGALPLQSLVTPNTAIYLASPFNSPTKFNKLFYQLMEQDLPSPLDFLANLNNAALFQLAQLFATTGNSLFLLADQQQIEQPLTLAQLDLASGMTTQALVGWGIEDPTGTSWEGSCWWLLSRESTSQQICYSGQQQTETLSTLLPPEHYLQFGLRYKNGMNENGTFNF